MFEVTGVSIGPNLASTAKLKTPAWATDSYVCNSVWNEKTHSEE